MKHCYYDKETGGKFIMTTGSVSFHYFPHNAHKEPFNIIIWNRGNAQCAVLDGIQIAIPANTFFAINATNTFSLNHPNDVVIWQFNNEFYCISAHDHEVACLGLLFHGWRESDAILLGDSDTAGFSLLYKVFTEEFTNCDNIQGDMLQILLKRLIIKLTRLVKIQAPSVTLTVVDLDTIRAFNILVEQNYKQLYKVREYAKLLHKSPKTLSNLFAKYNNKSPMKIILERRFLESKRLLLYTDKNASEIGYELGFEEPGHFSRFFRKMSGQSPSAFREVERKKMS